MKNNRNPMKKTLLLVAAASLVGASPLMADVDLFITGSTAFRANVHDACLQLFSPAPTEFTGTPATGGDSATGSKAAQWTMTGTPISSLTTISGTLTIHALFTGSIQGGQTVEQGTKLVFLDKTGARMTNTPTIGFSDSSTLVSPYPVDGVNFAEENVAVQPFVMVKSTSTATAMASITNVTWDQLKTMISLGRIPLSAWTHQNADTNTFIYLIERTKDSGTRRTETAEMGYAYNTGTTIYNWDATNKLFYKGTNTLDGPTGGTGGGASIGVVGPAGNNNANLVWGSGYVGGGDIANVMKDNSANNLSIAMLSMGDSKGITGVNWSQVLPFNGLWPTAQGPAIAGATTNDYSTITLGMYPLWGFEVLVYPLVDPSTLHSDQNLTAAQLGDQNTPGTILGVLDNQTSGTPVVGSIQALIEASKTSGATAIRNSEMHVTRPIVGGPIFP